MNLSSIKVKNIFISLLFIVLFFQQTVFFDKIPLISYIDEISVILMIIYLLFNFRPLFMLLRSSRIDKAIVIASVISIIIGIFSSLTYQLQSLFISLLDMFLCIKFLVAYFFIRVYTRNNQLNITAFNPLFLVLSLFIIFSFLINAVFKVFDYYDIRFGIKSIQLFFLHPVFLSIALMILISVMTLNVKKHRINSIIVVFLLIVLLFTLRTSSIAFILIYIAAWVYIKFLKLITPKTVFLALCFIITLFIGFDQFARYYQRLDNVRGVMLNDGFKYAINLFPLGNGFGTFGSFCAIKYGSPIYTELNYYSLWMFTSFSTDCFLALSLGQFGLIGTLCWIIVLICFILKAFKQKSEIIFLATFPVGAYMLISMLNTTSIFHPALLCLILSYGMILEAYNQKFIEEL